MTEVSDCGTLTVTACGIIVFLKHCTVTALQFFIVQLHKGNTEDLLSRGELQFGIFYPILAICIIYCAYVLPEMTGGI